MHVISMATIDDRLNRNKHFGAREPWYYSQNACSKDNFTRETQTANKIPCFLQGNIALGLFLL